MFIDEPNQDVQPEQETEQEDDGSSESESSDPLDTLSEAELRAEAKKLRAIANRKKESRDTNHGERDDVVRKSDFERANEAKARTKLKDKGDAVSKEILENWDSLAPVYGKVASRGKNSEDDIIEDLFDAHAVWKRSNASKIDTTKEASSDVAALAGTGGAAPSESTPKKERIIRSQASMNDWYNS